LTSTNYLPPEDFKKLVDAIPLVTEYNKSKLLSSQKKKVPNDWWIRLVLKTQYCMALRISEVLTIVPSDFNFKRKILTLNHTKTGFKHCKCSKWKKKKLIKSDINCLKCKGKGKVRVKQFTSIPPDFLNYGLILKLSTMSQDELLFPFTRQLIWSYVKKAAVFAKLELGEQQDERYIEGAWTHLIRKSRAKMMIELGASEVMVKVKLRHTFSVTERYTKPDINALIKWEEENIDG